VLYSASSETDSDDEDVRTSLVRGDCRPSRHSRRGGVSSNLEEGTVQNLVQLFMMLVHVKNPILEVETLRSYVRQIKEDGPSWDGKSCLVFLACALGAVARPFKFSPRDELNNTVDFLTDFQSEL